MTERVKKRAHAAAWLIALALLIFGVLSLEDERLSVAQSTMITQAGPVNLYRHTSGSDGPLVFVAHGFAGSHQMMQYISRDLARAGYIVAAFDFYGHGRNTQLLSPDVTRIEGTTQQLVEQTLAVTNDVRAELGLTQANFGLVGHSMATDIIIRAAAETQGATSIAAISMYSDAVTETFPQNLLILSGEWEGRLREVGLRLVAQVDPQGMEGKTVSNGTVLRRTDFVPFTEHVAVLYSVDTQREIRDWFARTLPSERADASPVKGQGLAILSAFAGLIALFVLSVQLMPRRPADLPPLTLTRYAMALVTPALLASAAAALGPSAILGLSAFGTLLWFLLVWGLVQLICVGRRNWDLSRPRALGFVLLLIGGGAIFAFALDRYAAAFLPTGIRLPLMAVLLPASILFACADRLVVREAPVWRRFLARFVAVATLAICMVALGDFGLLFTVVPVLSLFYLIYGTMGRAVARRFGPLTAGLALGVILAWSIAASTPLFAV